MTLRISRLAILQQLIAFATQLLAGLRGIADVARFARISRWMHIAMALCFHIRQGALDVPRPARKRRVPRDEETETYFETEADERYDEFDRERGYEHEVQRLLDRPFGEAVALICKGLGMTPDWETWAAEPWAQEEIRTQPEGSPYEGWAQPRTAALEPPPKPRPAPPPETPRLAAPPGQAPPPDRPSLRDQIDAARQRAARRRAYY